MSNAASILAAVAASQARRHEWIVTRLAAECGEPSTPARPNTCATRASVRAEESPPAASVKRFLDAAGPQDTGPGYERKLRVTHFARADDGALEVEFVPTTWELGRAFHMALTAQAAPVEAIGEWVDAACAGRPVTPGLAAVHALVLTRDHELVVMRRSERVLYRPGHWSATLEEQLVAEDFESGGTLERAVVRGVREELGLAVPELRAHFVTPLLELETLNLALLFLARVEASADEVRGALAQAADADDVDAIELVHAEPAALRALAQGGRGPDGAPLHPTSALRLAALARWIDQARP